MVTYRDDMLMLASIAIICSVAFKKQLNNQKKKRGPDRKWIRHRENRGVMNTLVEELRLQDSFSYRNWMRMDEDCFNHLVNLIQYDIIKQNTILQTAISPAETLAVTLKFLTTGMTYREFHIVLEWENVLFPELFEKYANLLEKG